MSRCRYRTRPQQACHPRGMLTWHRVSLEKLKRHRQHRQQSVTLIIITGQHAENRKRTVPDPPFPSFLKEAYWQFSRLRMPKLHRYSCGGNACTTSTALNTLPEHMRFVLSTQ